MLMLILIFLVMILMRPIILECTGPILTKYFTLVECH